MLKSEFSDTKGVKMIVKDLETMEKIVANNYNLYWDGWTVVETKQSDIAKTAVNGIRRKGKWFLAKRFVPDHNGWDIPNRYKV
jgi:hypothetical protein